MNTKTTPNRFTWAAVCCLIFSFTTIQLTSQPSCFGGVLQDVRPPVKADLIKTLDAILPLLEAKDYAGAAKYVVIPPQMDVEQLAGILKAREISASGIRQLEKDAKFGTAIELYGKDRATSIAGRFDSDVTKCFGFKHVSSDVTAEVVGLWDGSQFKLVRIDDVGKLESSDSEIEPEATANPKPAQNAAVPKPVSKAEAIQQAAMSLPGLLKAVEENPADVSARANLAMAYFRIGNTPESWKQLMTARESAPNNKGLARGIDSLINAFTNQGIFTVGVPTETVLALMGKPTQKVDLTNRERWVYGHWGIDFEKNRVHEIVDLRGITEAVYQPTEFIKSNLGGETWVPGLRRKVKGKATAFYFVPGETISDHKQLVIVDRLVGLTEGLDIQAISKRVIDDEAKLLRGSMHKVLKISDDSAIIAVKIPGVGDNLARHQLVRLMMGPKDLHRLSYTLKSADDPSQETQMKWLKIFEAATLEKVN